MHQQAHELIIGGAFAADPLAKEVEAKGAKLFPYAVKSAATDAVARVEKAIGKKR